MTATGRLDLHVHSRHSPDSRLPVSALAARAAAVGLRGFALTDHNSVAGHAELRDVARTYPGLLLLPGVEVSTRDGHLLAYGVAEAPLRGRDLESTADWVRDRGGEPVISHPFRLRHGAGGRLAAVAHVTGLEVRNAHNSEASNRRAAQWAELRHLAATGGSDAHRLDDVGRAVTLFPESVSTVDDLLEAIRTGRTSADGASMPFGGRVALALSNGAKYLARGLRSV